MSAKKKQGTFCFCLPFCMTTKSEKKKQSKPRTDGVERTQSNIMRSLNSGPISVNRGIGNENWNAMNQGIQNFNRFEQNLNFNNQQFARESLIFQQQQALQIPQIEFPHPSQDSCPTDEVRQRNKVRIKTQIPKKDVKFVVDYPEETELQCQYRYCCPICLRYFNAILVSNCCQNYICRLCIGEMAKRAKKHKQFVIKCAHCLENDFKLSDVNPDEQLKYYTDTPFKQGITQTPQNINTSVRLKDALLSPLKFNLDEDTALKTNYQQSSNGKIHCTPYKIQNLEELALGLPNLYVDSQYLQSPPQSKAQQLMDVEEVKNEEDSNHFETVKDRSQWSNLSQREHMVQLSPSGEALMNHFSKLEESKHSIFLDKMLNDQSVNYQELDLSKIQMHLEQTPLKVRDLNIQIPFRPVHLEDNNMRYTENDSSQTVIQKYRDVKVKVQQEDKENGMISPLKKEGKMRLQMQSPVSQINKVQISPVYQAPNQKKRVFQTDKKKNPLKQLVQDMENDENHDKLILFLSLTLKLLLNQTHPRIKIQRLGESQSFLKKEPALKRLCFAKVRSTQFKSDGYCYVAGTVCCEVPEGTKGNISLQKRNPGQQPPLERWGKPGDSSISLRTRNFEIHPGLNQLYNNFLID